MIARFRQQQAPQIQHVRQIQIVPSRQLRPPQTLIARVQPRAKLHHHTVRMLRRKPPHFVVNQRSPAAAAHLRSLHPRKFAEIIVNHLLHAHRFRIRQQRVRPAVFHRLRPQRNQHGFGQYADLAGRNFIVFHCYDSRFLLITVIILRLHRKNGKRTTAAFFGFL